jgi:hypothetical protein
MRINDHTNPSSDFKKYDETDNQKNNGNDMESPRNFRTDEKFVAVKRIFTHHELKMVVDRRPEKNALPGAFKRCNLKDNRNEFQ